MTSPKDYATYFLNDKIRRLAEVCNLDELKEINKEVNRIWGKYHKLEDMEEERRRKMKTMSDLAMDAEDKIFRARQTGTRGVRYLFCNCGNILNEDRMFCEDCV